MWTTRGFERKPEIIVQLLRNRAGQVNFVGITSPHYLISQRIHFIHLSPCHRSREELLIVTLRLRADLSKPCVNFSCRRGPGALIWLLERPPSSSSRRKLARAPPFGFCRTKFLCILAVALYPGWELFFFFKSMSRSSPHGFWCNWSGGRVQERDF